jgi:hypothetical protein
VVILPPYYPPFVQKSRVLDVVVIAVGQVCAETATCNKKLPVELLPLFHQGLVFHNVNGFLSIALPSQ